MHVRQEPYDRRGLLRLRPGGGHLLGLREQRALVRLLRQFQPMLRPDGQRPRAPGLRRDAGGKRGVRLLGGNVRGRGRVGKSGPGGPAGAGQEAETWDEAAGPGAVRGVPAARGRPASAAAAGSSPAVDQPRRRRTPGLVAAAFREPLLGACRDGALAGGPAAPTPGHPDWLPRRVLGLGAPPDHTGPLRERRLLRHLEILGHRRPPAAAGKDVPRRPAILVHRLQSRRRPPRRWLGRRLRGPPCVPVTRDLLAAPRVAHSGQGRPLRTHGRRQVLGPHGQRGHLLLGRRMLRQLHLSVAFDERFRQPPEEYHRRHGGPRADRAAQDIDWELIDADARHVLGRRAICRVEQQGLQHLAVEGGHRRAHAFAVHRARRRLADLDRYPRLASRWDLEALLRHHRCQRLLPDPHARPRRPALHRRGRRLAGRGLVPLPGDVGGCEAPRL
mmetsp:Transcript_80640/g.233174  ORF Transcript_80640/g.233174 Transcript_80640/m.233174 type:complete len:445 (-) Transcript_80640:316-1650(-)